MSSGFHVYDMYKYTGYCAAYVIKKIIRRPPDAFVKAFAHDIAQTSRSYVIGQSRFISQSVIKGRRTLSANWMVIWRSFNAGNPITKYLQIFNLILRPVA